MFLTQYPAYNLSLGLGDKYPLFLFNVDVSSERKHLCPLPRKMVRGVSKILLATFYIMLYNL